jgi:hypothetical protein
MICRSISDLAGDLDLAITLFWGELGEIAMHA